MAPGKVQCRNSRARLGSKSVTAEFSPGPRYEQSQTLLPPNFCISLIKSQSIENLSGMFPCSGAASDGVVILAPHTCAHRLASCQLASCLRQVAPLLRSEMSFVLGGSPTAPNALQPDLDLCVSSPSSHQLLQISQAAREGIDDATRAFHRRHWAVMQKDSKTGTTRLLVDEIEEDGNGDGGPAVRPQTAAAPPETVGTPKQRRLIAVYVGEVIIYSIESSLLSLDPSIPPSFLPSTSLVNHQQCVYFPPSPPPENLQNYVFDHHVGQQVLSSDPRPKH